MWWVMSLDLICLIRKGWKIILVILLLLIFINVDEVFEFLFVLVLSFFCDNMLIILISNFRFLGYNGLLDLILVSFISWLVINEMLMFGLFSWKKWKNFYKFFFLKW